MTNKIDKQRLDAYAQAVLASTAGDISTLNDSTILYGCKQRYTLAKAMMDYVDSQAQEQEDNSWIENTGRLPLDRFTKVDLLFSDKDSRFNVQAGSYRWEITGFEDSYYITKWRLTQ